MAWRDEVTSQQWDDWMKFAKKVSRQNQVQKTSLGYEDYAAQAIEKLLKERVQPDNVEAWLRRTISNLYIDRFRKIQRRGGASNRDLNDEEWEREMVSYAGRSASNLVIKMDSVDQVLAILNVKERTILIMATAGFDNHEIAHELGYASNKVVATRLKQIIEKVQTEIEKLSSSQRF